MNTLGVLAALLPAELPVESESSVPRTVVGVAAELALWIEPCRGRTTSSRSTKTFSARRPTLRFGCPGEDGVENSLGFGTRAG
jgi:hypothetical protein